MQHYAGYLRGISGMVIWYQLTEVFVGLVGLGALTI